MQEQELTLEELRFLQMLDDGTVSSSNMLTHEPILNNFAKDYNPKKDISLFGEPIKDFFPNLDIYIDFYRDAMFFTI